jgi:hypothetical protein
MRKLLIAAMAVLIATPALADWRRERRHYQPPQRHHHQRNIAPWVAGGLALGALGAYALTRPSRCWEEPIVDDYGRQLYNRYGQPLFQRLCN